jgi:hypothetical protein
VTAEDLHVPRLEQLASVQFNANDPADCPECKARAPIVEDMGHGDDYKKEHPDYVGGYVTLQGA